MHGIRALANRWIFFAVYKQILSKWIYISLRSALMANICIIVNIKTANTEYTNTIFYGSKIQ